MPLETIDAPDDPRLAPYRHAADPVRLREHGLFAAEGRLVVRTLLTASPLATRSVLVTRPALDGLSDVLPAGSRFPILVVPQAVMNGIVGFNIHRGCLALGERPPDRSIESLLQDDPPRLVVLEDVSNADNVGGIFRCAAAFGAAVVMGPHCADPLYRKAIRTSMGAALRVPFAPAAAWPGTLDVLRGSGYHVVALTPGPEADDLDATAGAISRMPHVALLIGAEGSGLSATALAGADRRIRIRIDRSVDSLNAAVATGIALHRLAFPDP